MRRDHLIVAVVTALAALLATVAVCAAAVSLSQGGRLPGAPMRFRAEPSDRPLLSAAQARTARSTGVCSFNIGGEHFVVKGLPREYVDYGRMPV